MLNVVDAAKTFVTSTVPSSVIKLALSIIENNISNFLVAPYNKIDIFRLKHGSHAWQVITKQVGLLMAKINNKDKN